MNKKSRKQKVYWSKKLDYFYRWAFGAIYANNRICNGHISDTAYSIKGIGEFHVGENDVGECNMSSLILSCCAVEMYGRILLGHTHSTERVSKESFVAFIKTYFPKSYSVKAEMIYSRYRCGLIHSYVIGAKSSEGILPTRNGRDHDNEHLQFIDNRLVINIDVFTTDLRKAFEKYFNELKNNKTKKVHLVTVRSENLQKNANIVLSDF